MSAERNEEVFTSFEEVREAKAFPNPNYNHKETCPVCGKHARYPEHPLCPGCNKQYIQEIAEEVALVDSEEPILTRVEWAVPKGRETLQRVQKELEVAESMEREKQKPYWEQAHREVQENLKKRGLVRIDPQAFNKAKGLRFGRLWNNDPEHTKLSKRVFGLRKAVESLEGFLEEAAEASKTSEE